MPCPHCHPQTYDDALKATILSFVKRELEQEPLNAQLVEILTAHGWRQAEPYEVKKP